MLRWTKTQTGVNNNLPAKQFIKLIFSDSDSSESDSSDSDSEDSDYETKSSSGSLSPTEVKAEAKEAPKGLMAPPKPGMVLVKRKRAKIDVEEEKAKKQKLEKLKMLEMTKSKHKFGYDKQPNIVFLGKPPALTFYFYAQSFEYLNDHFSFA